MTQAQQGIKSMAPAITVGGRTVEECPRKCSECRGAIHHWIEHFPDQQDTDALSEPENQRDREILEDWEVWQGLDETIPDVPVYWICKHCPMWIRHYESCDHCGGPLDGGGYCISTCNEAVAESQRLHGENDVRQL